MNDYPLNGVEPFDFQVKLVAPLGVEPSTNGL